jgi:hypothetical protein
MDIAPGRGRAEPILPLHAEGSFQKFNHSDPLRSEFVNTEIHIIFQLANAELSFGEKIRLNHQ